MFQLWYYTLIPQRVFGSSFKRIYVSTALTSTQGPEILGRLRYNISAQFHDNASGGLSTDGHVEVAFGVGPDYSEKMEVS